MSTSIARQNMVQQQIKPWNIFDIRVLEAISAIPRERFVPEAYKEMALMDLNIPLPSGSQMFTPKEEARIAQALEISSNDTVLHIGVGCGYLTALLAALSKSVYGVEIEDANYQLALGNLQMIKNVTLEKQCGLSLDVSNGYDVIVCTASVKKCPNQLLEQLDTGGRLMIIEGFSPVMTASILKKEKDNHIIRQPIFETNCDRLVNLDQNVTFSL